MQTMKNRPFEDPNRSKNEYVCIGLNLLGSIFGEKDILLYLHYLNFFKNQILVYEIVSQPTKNKPLLNGQFVNIQL